MSNSSNSKVKRWQWCGSCNENHKLIKVREICPPRPVYESCKTGEVLDIFTIAQVCTKCGYGNINAMMLMSNPPVWKCSSCSYYNNYGP